MTRSDGVVDDAELIRRIQTGTSAESEDAFDQLVKRHTSLLVHHLSHDKGQTVAEANEIVWETWMRVWRRIGRFEYRGAKFFAWIRRFADFIIQERWRQRSPCSSLEEFEERGNDSLSDADTESEAIANLSREQFKDAVLELLPEAPADLRAPLESQLICDFTPKEIMELYGWSRSKTDVTSFRAREWLRERLTKRYGQHTIDGWRHPT